MRSVEATGNVMAVVRVLSPFVARVIIADPLQVKAIAYAHCQNGQDRRRSSGDPARGRLSAGGLDTRH